CVSQNLRMSCSNRQETAMLYVKTLHETGEPHQFSHLLKLIPTDTPTGNTSSVISKYRHVIKIRACRETLSWRHNKRDGEAATSCASSQSAQSLTNWVERMRRTYLVLLIWHKTTVKRHRGEANSTSASMNPIESPTVGFMLVLPLLFFYTYI